MKPLKNEKKQVKKLKSKKVKLLAMSLVVGLFFLVIFLFLRKSIEKGAELKVGFVTDIEYSQNRKIGSKITREGLVELAKVRSDYNDDFHPDLVVGGGDYVRVGKGEKVEFERLFFRVKDSFSKIQAPKIFLTGGAEEKVFSREEMKKQLGLKYRYKVKKIKGVRVIALDMKGFENEKKEKVTGKINKEELEWLRGQIAKNDPIVIFSHFSPVAIPLKDGWRDDFKDEEDLVELIQKSNNVLAVVTGNSPVNYAQKHYKVPYISVASLVQEDLIGNNLKLKITFKEGEYKLEGSFPNGEWFRILQNKGERRSSKLKTSKVTKYNLEQEEWKFLARENGLHCTVSKMAGTESNLASGTEGNLFVAYQDEEHDNAARVKFFDGQNWEDLGKFGDFSKGVLSSEKGGDPNMAIKDDEIYIAFMDKSADKRARVLQWKTSWKPLSDGINPQGFISTDLGHEPVLSFDKSQKNLYAAFSTGGEKEDKECQHSCKVQVKRWNGFFWQTVGGEFISGDFASEVDIISSKKDDAMFVVYQNHSDKGRIHVQKWNGATWVHLSDNFHPSDSATDIAGFSPSIALDNEDNLYLVYTGLDFNKTYITRWNGINWEDVGNGMVSTGRTAESTIAIEDDHIIVAFSQLRKDAKIEVEEEGTKEVAYKKGDYWRLRVVKRNSDGWGNLPSQNFEQGFISVGNGKADPSILIDKGKLFLSFTDAKNGNATRVAYYDLNSIEE